MLLKSGNTEGRRWSQERIFFCLCNQFLHQNMCDLTWFVITVAVCIICVHVGPGMRGTLLNTINIQSSSFSLRKTIHYSGGSDEGVALLEVYFKVLHDINDYITGYLYYFPELLNSLQFHLPSQKASLLILPWLSHDECSQLSCRSLNY